jgi:hypothetical protein
MVSGTSHHNQEQRQQRERQHLQLFPQQTTWKVIQHRNVDRMEQGLQRR